jgi:tetratricopeptide (TPR) repeat protein
MYLPLAAVLTVVAGAAATAVGSLKNPEVSRLPASLLLASAIVALGLVARERSRDYASEERLWQHDIAHQPAHARPRISYGTALFAAGRYAEAEAQLRAAVQLDSEALLAQLNLGAVLCARGRLDEGIAHLERALAIDDDHPDVLATLGDAYTARGDDARAVPVLTRALAARPHDVIRLNRLGWLLATSRDAAVRDPSRALALAAQAVTLTGKTDVMSLNTLAAAQAANGRSADAVDTMTVAIAAAQAQGLVDIIPELDRRRAAYAGAR